MRAQTNHKLEQSLGEHNQENYYKYLWANAIKIPKKNTTELASRLEHELSEVISSLQPEFFRFRWNTKVPKVKLSKTP